MQGILEILEETKKNATSPEDKNFQLFLDDIEIKIKDYIAFQKRLSEMKVKIIAERDLKPDAYTRPITY
jgi:hypothetical protein